MTTFADLPDLFDFADMPENADDLPQGEVDDRKEMHVPAANEDHGQGSTDDHGLDQLPDGFHLNGHGLIKYQTTDDHTALLTLDHWCELAKGSSIAPEVIRGRGYRSIGAPADRGRLQAKGITAKALEPEHFPGLVLPRYKPDGRTMTLQWKPARPWLDDDKAKRYAIQAQIGNHLDVHPAQRPLLADTGRRLWIGEGTKKGDALVSRDELAVNLVGVWSWRTKAGPLPDWEHIALGGRDAVIAYDADALTNPKVLQAMTKLGAWLQSRGAQVRYLIVPGEVNGRQVKGVDDYLAAGGTVDQLLAHATPTPPQATKTDDAFTDSRLAERVADEVLDGRYIWISGLGWLRWDGRRWAECSDKNVGDAVRRWSIDRFQEAVAKGTTAGRVDRDEVQGWMAMESAGKQRAVLGLAAGIVECHIDELDGDPDLLNTLAGVVDLQTGQLRPHDPDLMMAKITAAEYRPDATHPDWTKVLDAIPDDVRAWFQLRMGQGTTGHMTPDDLLLVNQGSGANGKTTAMDTLGRALGDYYLLASDRILLANPDQHPTELMDLQGVRLAVAEETPEARRLSVSRLKKTVGTPRINARRIRRDPVTFDATHTFILSTNYRPVVEETDRGTWRRLALVRWPFTFRKPGEELAGPLDRTGDPTLRDRARLDPDVLAAALAWMVDGARAWYEAGRIMPPLPARVEADTRDWRAESDQVLAYLDDRVRFDPGRHVMATDLLDDLNDWLQARGHRPWSDKTLAARFGDHEEVGRHHVEKRKTRRSAALSRPFANDGEDLVQLADRAPAPATYAAWHGVRFATDDDHDQDPDPGQGERTNQAAGGEDTAATSNVPAVPADLITAKIDSTRGVIGEPGTPGTSADDEDLLDQLDDLLDWTRTIGPSPASTCPECQAEELAAYPDVGLTVCLAEGCDYVRARASFTDWLLDQTEHPDDLVRTLANDAADDRTWPDVNDLDRLARYIADESGHDEQARQALLRAWSLWSGQAVDREDEAA